MSDENKNVIKSGAKEGLLRLGVVDSKSSIENPIDKYVSTYKSHVNHRVPVKNDYTSSLNMVSITEDYPEVEYVSEDVFNNDKNQDNVKLLVYDEDDMVMPHIVKVEKQNTTSKESEDEIDYNLELHIAHQDTFWYLRNRLVSKRNKLILFFIIMFVISLLTLVFFLNSSSIFGFIGLLVSLTSISMTLYTIPLIILSEFFK